MKEKKQKIKRKKENEEKKLRMLKKREKNLAIKMFGMDVLLFLFQLLFQIIDLWWVCFLMYEIVRMNVYLEEVLVFLSQLALAPHFQIYSLLTFNPFSPITTLRSPLDYCVHIVFLVVEN